MQMCYVWKALSVYLNKMETMCLLFQGERQQIFKLKEMELIDIFHFGAERIVSYVDFVICYCIQVI